MAKFGEYVRHLGGYVTGWRGNPELEIAGAVCDSRKVGTGDMFCAMRGEKRDGHDFIDMAVQQGAVAFLVERPETVPEGFPFIAVNEAYPAFGLVAELSSGLPAQSLRLVGITGTNGKTTTAWLLRAICREAGIRTGMIGTVEYDLGAGTPAEADRTTPTPFELNDMLDTMRSNQVDMAVMEVSSHALAQGRLGTAKFAIGIFTNLTRDHFDYHHDFENYYQCKKKLFADMLMPGCPAVINLSNEWGKRLCRELRTAGIKCLPFAFEGEELADFGEVAVVRELCQNVKGTSFVLDCGEGCGLRITSPLTGRYNAENLAGAVLAAKALGLPAEAIATALKECQGAPGRLQRIGNAPGQVAVYVDYAHTDDAIRQALSALRKICHGRLGIVFGCGGNRDRAKRPLMAKAACECADVVYVTSDNPRFEEPDDIIADVMAGVIPGTAVKVEADRPKAIGLALSELGAEDILLVAGKGHEDYQEIKGVKHHYNDAEEILRRQRNY